MTCPKCSCKFFKPGDGYDSCIKCGQHVLHEVVIAMPDVNPVKHFDGKTQEDRTSSIRTAIIVNWNEIESLRALGKAWQCVKDTVGLIGSLSSISNHYRQIKKEREPQPVSMAKRKQYSNTGRKKVNHKQLLYQV